MRYSCVLCAPYTFSDDLHRHRDDFHHRINICCTFSVRSASVNAIRCLMKIFIESIIIMCLLNIMAWKAIWAHRTGKNEKQNINK